MNAAPPAPPAAPSARERGGGEVIMVAGRDPRDVRGGHASYVLAHALAARRAGFEPHVFCSSATAAVTRTEFGVVHQVRAPMFGSDGINGLWKLWVALTAPLVSAAVVRFLAGRPGPHLVHGFGTCAYAGVVTARRLARAGLDAVALSSVYTPVEHEYACRAGGVSPTHGAWMRARYRAELWWARRFVVPCERLAHQRSQLVVLNYESSRRLFLAAYGPGAPTRKLPYASTAAFADDAGRPRPVGAPPGVPSGQAPLIVSVSRHDPRKGLDGLLHALAELRARGIPFRACLTSSGPLLLAHRRLATRLGLDDVTVLTGWVPDAFAYLRAADVFVLPSLQEGSGALALLEALQAGCAVVASDVDGVPEDVVHGESALLVPPGDPAALARALEAVLGDAGLRARLSRAARATFEARFSAAVFAAAIRDVYAELGGRARQPA